MGERPLLYDVFCGAGGASVGYHRAGFDVVGIDNRPQKNYPFRFIEMDAFEFFGRVQSGEFAQPDAWHCSPPCQAYSVTRSLHDNAHPQLVEPTRKALQATSRPWVIENVVGAPLNTVIELCGAMFGLKVYRHRRFESNVMLLQPHHPRHVERTLQRVFRADWDGFVTVTGGQNVPVQQARDAMGIQWMAGRELSQAIPPDYAFWIGKQLLACVTPHPTPAGGA